MRRLFALGLVLFVPLLLSAQIELKVFFNTDQEDVYLTSDVRSLVFGVDKVHLKLHAADAKEYPFAEFDSLMLDETPPVLSEVTSGTVESGTDVSATSDKDGTIYLVPDGTAVEVADFDAAVSGNTAVSTEATADTEAVLSTTGLADGDYLVYAVDDDGRISDPSATIVLLTTGLNQSAIDAIRLYPNPVNEMLYFDGNTNLQEIVVIDLLGKERFRIENAGDISKINATALDKGVYFIKFSNIDNSATYKFIKK